MSAVEETRSKSVRSLVPARLDRLPWVRFHWLIVVGLGVSWILDGLEIQIVSQAGFKDSLHLTNGDIGSLGSVYLVGEVVGALFFGRITDRIGRRKIFMLTLAIYLGRIGPGRPLVGPVVAVRVPLRRRHRHRRGVQRDQLRDRRADPVPLPGPGRHRHQRHVLGRRCSRGERQSLPVVLGRAVEPGLAARLLHRSCHRLCIIGLRRHIPESPRWQMTHGFHEEAERTVDEIEARVKDDGGQLSEVDDAKAIEIVAQKWIPYPQLARIFLKKYPKRTALGFTLMATQAFLYNAIFFTYALVLQHFFGVSKSGTGYYFIPFALGNLAGPLLLGPLFDTIGRRRMISFTYVFSGALLAVSAYLFHQGSLNATTQTIFWCVIFFFASAGASSAYLTVSEIFPLELRGQAISFFFSIAQVFGAIATSLYGHLIGGANVTHPDRNPLSYGYFLGAGIMIAGGVVAFFLAFDAERQSLEDISEPLSAAAAHGGSS